MAVGPGPRPRDRGVLLVLQRLLSPDQLERWGWRIPFVIGAGCAVLALWLRRGLEETAALWPPVQEAYKWVKRVARLLKNKEEMAAKEVRRRLVQLLGRMRQAAALAAEPSVGQGLRHFLKVSDGTRTRDRLDHKRGSQSVPSSPVGARGRLGGAPASPAGLPRFRRD